MIPDICVTTSVVRRLFRSEAHNLIVVVIVQNYICTDSKKIRCDSAMPANDQTSCRQSLCDYISDVVVTCKLKV